MRLTNEVFYSLDRKHKGEVRVDGDVYVCLFFEDNRLIGVQPCPGKSIWWARDVAENFTLGILNVDREGDLREPAGDGGIRTEGNPIP